MKILLADLRVYCGSLTNSTPAALDGDALAAVPERRRICIVTYDDRNLPYVREYAKHNRGVAEAKGYEYRFLNECSYRGELPPYWIKVFLVRDMLETGDVDFVMWLDSDAMLCADAPPLEALLQEEERCFWVAKDPPLPRPIRKFASVLCAGVWIVRSDERGRAFMNEWADRYEPCLWSKGREGWKSSGIWTLSTYEQGQLSGLARRHRESVVTLPYRYFNSASFDADAQSPKFTIHRMGKSRQAVN